MQDQNSFNINLGVHHTVTTVKGLTRTSDMKWRGILKGWSFHVVEEDECEE